MVGFICKFCLKIRYFLETEVFCIDLCDFPHRVELFSVYILDVAKKYEAKMKWFSSSEAKRRAAAAKSPCNIRIQNALFTR